MKHDPLTRLAAANPVPGNMPALTVDVETIKRVRPTDGLTRRAAPRHRRGSLIAVFAFAVTCAVVLVGALSSLHRAQESASAPSTASVPQSEFASLTRTLAVFDEPSSAERVACRGAHPLAVCTLRTESSQVRSIAVGDGYTALIEPTDVTRTTHLAHRGPAIVLALHGPVRGPVQTSAPIALTAVRRHGLLVSTFTRLGQNQGVILVPNGVAGVSLTDLHVRGSTGKSSRIKLSTSKVAHNVAIFRLKGATARNLAPSTSALGRYFVSSTGRLCHADLAVYALPATVQMAWNAPHGKIIRRTSVVLRVDVGITNPPQSTVSRSWRCP